MCGSDGLHGESTPVPANESSGKEVTTGGARAVALSTVRGVYQTCFRLLTRYAAAPHKVFRPENPTIARFEEIFAPSQVGSSNTGRSRGFVSLWWNHGFQQAAATRAPAITLNALLGTVLFTSYDLLRDPAFTSKRLKDSDKNISMAYLQRVGLAGAAAGALHGSICAPVEVLARRLQSWEPALSTFSQSFRAALRDMRSAQDPNPLGFSGAVLPLSIARDSVGIAVFFTTFEVVKLSLYARSPHRANRPEGALPAGDGVNSASASNLSQIPPGWWRTGSNFLAGGTAGVLYRIASNPVDVLLLRRMEAIEVLHRQPPPVGVHVRSLVRELGLRGLLPEVRVLFSVFPSSALGLVLYEWLQ